MTTPSIFGRSFVGDRLDRVLAEAGQGEGALGEHRAAEQQAEVETEDRDDRGERGAQTVPR